MFGFMNKVKDVVSKNVTDLASKVKHEVTEFLEENKKLEENAQLEEKRARDAKLPWETININNNTSDELKETIKEEILDLANHEDNFLAEDSTYMFEFDFSMEDCKYQAIKIMEHDPKLGLLRNQLVPKKITEEKFWKNYFYNVELIKMKHAIKAEEEAEARENREEGEEEQQEVAGEQTSGKVTNNEVQIGDTEEEQEKDEVLSPEKNKSSESKKSQNEETVEVKQDDAENQQEETEDPDVKVNLGEGEKQEGESI